MVTVFSCFSVYPKSRSCPGNAAGTRGGASNTRAPGTSPVALWLQVSQEAPEHDGKCMVVGVTWVLVLAVASARR